MTPPVLGEARVSDFYWLNTTPFLLPLRAGAPLAGLAIIGLGTAVHVNLNDFYQIIDIRVLTISVIVLGCIVFVIAFCACCGAIRESKCMLGFSSRPSSAEAWLSHT
ncbi:hypothetical protein SFRURICE_010377 [Spodoptera frugiperda]|nr:hypothetical protein SFRURICE_010377 [Spodoptera frugiperda]